MYRAWGCCLKLFERCTANVGNKRKKPTWRSTPKVFHRVGLQINEPPGLAEMPFT